MIILQEAMHHLTLAHREAYSNRKETDMVNEVALH